MCGINCLVINESVDKNQFIKKRETTLKHSSLIRHRGPDWSGNYTYHGDNESVIMCHERLEIIDPHGGAQPLIFKYKPSEVFSSDILNKLENDYRQRNSLNDGNDVINQEYNVALCVNGEIFNYKSIMEECSNYSQMSNSDCESILALYIEHLYKFNETNSLDFNKLDGQFSFVLYDTFLNRLVSARDPIGITSLYIGSTKNFKNKKDLYISSEMKTLQDCVVVDEFKPGHFIDTRISVDYSFIPYYSKSVIGSWVNKDFNSNLQNQTNNNMQECCKLIRNTLTEAVDKRLMSDVPYGMLLSGGLDSSLVCSIAVKLANEGKMKLQWGNNFHTFSIGLEGSPDLENAQIVADFLGTQHHNFHFTVQEGLDAIKDVIYHLETFDVTTIRASTPMYLLSRKIKAMGVKMVLSGEGADELLGGYLYFLQAPNDEEFQTECQRRVKNLSQFDCLRANKSTMSWGVEGRFPFLDKKMVDLSFKIHPSLKRKNNIEKYVLRKAFDVRDDSGNPTYLPDSILWRQKEQFSDGVGYNWIDSIKELTSNLYTEEQFNNLSNKFSVNKPKTKEALYYRLIFNELFPNKDKFIKLWVPRTDWDNVYEDPSGRCQIVHNQKTV